MLCAFVAFMDVACMVVACMVMACMVVACMGVASMGVACMSLAHCSLSDIWISQKTRLCVVNLKDQFQTCLEAKLIIFLIWKFRSIILIILLFFAVVKSRAFCTDILSLCFSSWNSTYAKKMKITRPRYFKL